MGWTEDGLQLRADGPMNNRVGWLLKLKLNSRLQGPNCWAVVGGGLGTDAGSKAAEAATLRRAESVTRQLKMEVCVRGRPRKKWSSSRISSVDRVEMASVSWSSWQQMGQEMTEDMARSVEICGQISC